MKNLDDIKITCRADNIEMVLESMMNNKVGIFVCPRCEDHVFIIVGGDS